MKSTRKTELLVFITPKIVTDRSAARSAGIHCRATNRHGAASGTNMTTLRRLFSILAVLTLAACGGGGGSAGTPTFGGGTTPGGGNTGPTVSDIHRRPLRTDDSEHRSRHSHGES